MINIFIEDNVNRKRIEYVFNYIFNSLGLDFQYNIAIDKTDVKEDINIFYGQNTESDRVENAIYIKQSNKLFGENYLKPIKYTIKKYGKIINLLAEDELYINDDKEKNVIHTNIDMISDIFFMLTRYEEIVNKGIYEGERFKRFPADASLFFKEGILNRPIVNEHIELIWTWIDGMKLNYNRVNLWGEDEFALCLSHDVDFFTKYTSIKSIIRSLGKTILKDKSVKRTTSVIKNYIESKRDYEKDPFYTFKYIIDLEKKYGFTSSFYFMSGGTSEVDNFYDINDQRVLKLIKYMNDNKCEVGYHGSFNSYLDYEQMKKEKANLDRNLQCKFYGCRQHYLRFRAPETWKIQKQVGLKYDTSVGFADKAGFRCGTCIPFKPYDIFEDKIIDIWEIPLIVMEGTLFNDFYSGLTPEEGFNYVVNLINEVKRYGGVFTLLWHNSFLNKYDSKFDNWIPMYNNLMHYLGNSNCKSYTGAELVKHLEERRIK